MSVTFSLLAKTALINVSLPSLLLIIRSTKQAAGTKVTPSILASLGSVDSSFRSHLFSRFRVPDVILLPSVLLRQSNLDWLLDYAPEPAPSRALAACSNFVLPVPKRTFLSSLFILLFFFFFLFSIPWSPLVSSFHHHHYQPHPHF